MRVAVTGASGRLGSALIPALRAQSIEAVAWSRPRYDVDGPPVEDRLISETAPDAVVHCAAWTDVDGCAREPQLADDRNGTATGRLATACARAGVDLVVVSTNEVFDGHSPVGYRYGSSDRVGAVNAYGRSKLAGEIAAATAYATAVPALARLAVVRTAWLFGPPGNDFPEKVARAARRASSRGERLRLVRDEIGSPSYTPDVARAIARMLQRSWEAGIYQCVNAGDPATRESWGRAVLEVLGIAVPIEPVASASFVRSSTPPLRTALQPSMPEGCLIDRSWELALGEYAAALRERLEATAS